MKQNNSYPEAETTQLLVESKLKMDFYHRAILRPHGRAMLKEAAGYV